jgi:hypothetical protein
MKEQWMREAKVVSSFVRVGVGEEKGHFVDPPNLTIIAI